MRVRQVCFTAAAALISIVLGAGIAAAERFVPLPEPNLGDAQVVTADVLGLGREQMLVGRDEEITIYDEHFIVRWVIQGFLGRVTALAVDDVTGDGQAEIVAATDNAGAMYIFAQDGDPPHWTRIGEPYYLWQPAETLITGPLLAEKRSIVVVDEEKQLRVLQWNGSGLSVAWKNEAGQQVQWAALVDLTGSGSRKLVFTAPSGYIAVYVYADGRMHLRAERYPWGPILGLGWKHAAENSPGELFVVTGEHMVYYWQWLNSDMNLKGSFESEALSRWVGWVPNRGLWSANPDRVQFFSIGSSRLTPQERKEGLTGTVLKPFAEHWLAQDSHGVWQVWKPVDLDYLQVFVDGHMSPQPTVYWDGDLAYLCVEGLAALLGVEMKNSRTLIHPRTGSPVSMEPNERWVTYEGRAALPLENAPILENGVIFVSPEIAAYVGWTAAYDSNQRRLELYPSLDWFDSKEQ